jgi:hypothetical protein
MVMVIPIPKPRSMALLANDPRVPFVNNFMSILTRREYGVALAMRYILKEFVARLMGVQDYEGDGFFAIVTDDFFVNELNRLSYLVIRDQDDNSVVYSRGEGVEGVDFSDPPEGFCHYESVLNVGHADNMKYYIANYNYL